MKTEVAIAGGGLAGLSLAARLHAAKVDFHLFEARSRLGGRITALNTPTGAVDLGPSWFWPGQPRMAALARKFSLDVFPQYAEGDVVLEDSAGRVHRGEGFASMEGAFRIDGGMVKLIENLLSRLPAEALHLDATIRAVGEDGTIATKGGATWRAGKVIVALPPRLASRLNFTPSLEPNLLAALRDIPTWMAGHAKFVAVYDTPFWREHGLSGDAMSRRGPLAEIHDASGVHGSPAALFGFVGVPAAVREHHRDSLEAAALEQLARIFGPAAEQPMDTMLKDWAFDPATATHGDLSPPVTHPDYRMPGSLEGLWEDRLIFAVSELAPEMGGYMEGALVAAERAASHARQ